MDLGTLVAQLDNELRISDIPDYPPAHNGLQLSNSGVVTKVGAAVDACLPIIQQAVAAQVDFLLVHHGLFWTGVQPIRGAYYQKLKLAIDHGLAIYSAHIPLDVHDVFGNNAQLCALLEIESEPFFPWKGILLGRRARVRMNREELSDRLSKAVGGRVHLCPGGPAEVRDIGVISGGAGGEVAAVAALGIDTFITGEGPHHSYLLAEELGVNILYGGHYATETFGVQALAADLEQRFGLPYQFLDHPSGL